MIIGSKVRNFEHSVKTTKKGFANVFKNYFNKKERSENDGLSKNFVMNFQEVSMKSLVDLSFLLQDYKTFNNYLKYPLNDFKAIKAFKQYSSCIELQFISSLLKTFNFAESRDFSANLFQAANSYSRSKDLKWMIRNLIILADMCKTIRNFDDAAKCYLKIAYSLSSKLWLQAIFFEQAAWCYLKINQQRKFAFHIVKAGIIYENFKYKDYSFF